MRIVLFVCVLVDNCSFQSFKQTGQLHKLIAQVVDKVCYDGISMIFKSFCTGSNDCELYLSAAVLHN